MPPFGQLVPQLAVVINLPVADNPRRLVLAGDGLVPAGHVDDAQPPHAQPDVAVDEDAAVIRPAVDHLPGHPFEDRLLDGLAVHIKDAGNTAHVPVSVPVPLFRSS